MPLPASEDYLREKLNVAVDCLATSAAPIQRRLQDAAISALSRLTAEDFADADDRELFERIHAALTKLNAPAEVGQVPASAAVTRPEAL